MKLKLIKKLNEAKGTWSFFFEPEKEIKYLPGQFYYITLPELKYPDTKGPTRHFTLSRSPTEGNLLCITTRIREQSGYKKSLVEINNGSIVEGEGPDGTFILDENETGSHIFLAGGIGITPFRTFIKYNIDKVLKIPMHLIYSNSIPEEIVFRDELEEWSGKYPFFNLQLTISKPEESKIEWSGLKGRIDENFLKSLPKAAKNTTYWISGPPIMVDALEKVLGNLNISPRNIRSERFTGY